MFEKVDQKVSFPDLEKQLMARWKEEGTFQKSLDLRAGRPRFVFGCNIGPVPVSMTRSTASARNGLTTMVSCFMGPRPRRRAVRRLEWGLLPTDLRRQTVLW